MILESVRESKPLVPFARVRSLAGGQFLHRSNFYPRTVTARCKVKERGVSAGRRTFFFPLT